jgi:uncharacterized protein with PhoU and TrkA domain
MMQRGKTTPEEFATKSVQALNSHVNELESMAETILEAAQSKTAIPNLKEIFNEISDAAHECGSLVEYYGEEPMPEKVRRAIVSVQQEIRDCTGALIVHCARTT